MITFGDGAEEALVRVVGAIPAGCLVALVRTGDQLVVAPEIVRGQDVSFVRADDFGVWYWPLTQSGDRDGRCHYARCLPWADVEQIHVY